MRSRARILFAALLALSGSYRTARALPPPWTPLGPYGGDVRSLAADPRQPATLYAVTAGGAFRTADRGVSWSALNPRGDAGELAADPVHPGVLYLSVFDEGVIKSTDGGAHWAPANGGLPFQTAIPRDLAIDSGHPERLYLLTGAGLWRSVDAGVSWRLARADGGVRSIATSPLAGTAFLSTAAGVFRTQDSGASWQRLGHGLPTGPADGLAVSASDPRTVYAYFNTAGLYRSLDGGASWGRQRAPLPGGTLVAFAVSPRTPRLLYVSLSNGALSRSLDGGVLWTGLGGITGVKALAGAEPKMSGTVYAGLGTGSAGAVSGEVSGGVWRSEDAGTTWAPRNQGLSGLSATAVAVDPAQPDHLWAAIAGRAYRSFDRGARWLAASPLPVGTPSEANVRKVAVGAASEVLAATLQALWKSSDSGASWTLAFAPGQTPVRLIAVASPPSAGLYLEAGSIYEAGSVYRSTDGGASWQPEGDPGLVCGAGDLVVAPSNPQVLYAGGSGKSPAPYLCRPPSRRGWPAATTAAPPGPTSPPV